MIDGKSAISVGRTDDYHFKSVLTERTPSFEEIDLDLDGDRDLLLFESRITTEAFRVDADGFLTPVSSEWINEANSKIDDDSEWLLKRIARELKE